LIRFGACQYGSGVTDYDDYRGSISVALLTGAAGGAVGLVGKLLLPAPESLPLLNIIVFVALVAANGAGVALARRRSISAAAGSVCEWATSGMFIGYGWGLVFVPGGHSVVLLVGGPLLLGALAAVTRRFLRRYVHFVPEGVRK